MENHESSMPDDPGSHSEVRTHAPTLLGADQPGEQGEARVWAPSVWRRRAQLTAITGGAILLFMGCWVLRTPVGDLPDGLFQSVVNALIPAECAFAAVMLCCGWLQLRHPRYITTDNAGIGIGGLKGSRALRWSEIRSARSVHFAKIALQTDSGPLKISLHAYTEGLAEDLFAVIVNRANLYRSPDDACRFLPEDQVRDRYLARRENVVLERPPMPASRRFTNDTAAKRTFLVLAILMGVYIIGGAGVGIWFPYAFHNLNFEAHHAFNMRKGNPTLSPMMDMLDDLRGPASKSGSDDDADFGTATIWLNQESSAPLAAPDLPGYQILWTTAGWAPVDSEGARSSLYKYEVNFLTSKGPKSPTKKITASLAYASHRVSYPLHPEFADLGKRASDFLFLVNSEASALKESGPVIGSLPSPRSWRYVAVAASGSRKISGFEFEPVPTTEGFEPAIGKQLTGAVAAWLPGRFTGSRLSCDIIYRDGGVRHLVLSPGVQVKGIKVLWKMPAKYEKDLSKGPI